LWATKDGESWPSEVSLPLGKRILHHVTVLPFRFGRRAAASICASNDLDVQAFGLKAVAIVLPRLMNLRLPRHERLGGLRHLTGGDFMQSKNTIDPIDIHVGKRLILARNMRGLSQGKLGALVGVTFQQLQKYESGINRISASRLAHLASFLQLPVSWFFDEQPDAQKPNAAAHAPDNAKGMGGDIFHTKEIYRLVSAFYEIKNPRRREAAFNVLKSLAD
jgi:transcriptional regulator with XRE-family HTH domain